MTIKNPNYLLQILVAGFLIVPAAAQSENTVPPLLSLELNAVEQTEANCRLVFVAENKMGNDLDSLSLETVLFDAGGKVSRFTLFDFKSLPADKTRVRQFELPDTQCGTVSKILINGVAACKGAAFTGPECSDAMKLKSTTSTEISG